MGKNWINRWKITESCGNIDMSAQYIYRWLPITDISGIYRWYILKFSTMVSGNNFYVVFELPSSMWQKFFLLFHATATCWPVSFSGVAIFFFFFFFFHLTGNKTDAKPKMFQYTTTMLQVSFFFFSILFCKRLRGWVRREPGLACWLSSLMGGAFLRYSLSLHAHI